MTMDLAHVRDVMHRIRIQQIEETVARAIRRPGTFKGALMRSTCHPAIKVFLPQMEPTDFANILAYVHRSLGLENLKVQFA